MERLNLKSKLKELFPVFEQHELVEKIADNCQYFKLPGGTELMHTGSYISVVPLVLSGTIKVFREDTDGREIFLYYINSGESCALTLTACFKMEKSYIKAKIQEETEFIAIPVELVRNFHKEHPSWSKFVFSTEKATVMNVSVLHISHKEIADDLVTSREVISRLLKQMEKKQLLELARGRIKLTGLQKFQVV